MKKKTDLSDVLKVAAVVVLILIYLNIFWYFDGVESFGSGDVFICTVLGCVFSTALCIGVFCIIQEERIFKEGYYVVERNECGKITYRPYCYKYIGNFIIEKKSLWDDFESDKDLATRRIETVKAEKIEEERQRKCKTTYKVKEY